MRKVVERIKLRREKDTQNKKKIHEKLRKKRKRFTKKKEKQDITHLSAQHTRTELSHVRISSFTF